MQPIYFVETQHSRLGRWFIETDRDKNNCAHIVSLIRSGEVDPVKVLEVCEDEGTVRDVTEDFIRAAQSQADPEPFDHQAARFDHVRDERKHMERV